MLLDQGFAAAAAASEKGKVSVGMNPNTPKFELEPIPCLAKKGYRQVSKRGVETLEQLHLSKGMCL